MWNYTEKAIEVAKAEQALGDVTEYMSDPPIFYETVDVKDGDSFKRIRIKMKGSDLINKEKWVNVLADGGHFPHPAILDMKIKEFQAMQYARLGKRVSEKAEEEASDSYEFKMLVYEFCKKTNCVFSKNSVVRKCMLCK